MKNQACMPPVGRDKMISIVTLYIVSILIILAGTFFGVFSLLNNISIPVLSSQIPGVVFGVVVLFLGIRYLFSVNKLKDEVFKSTSTFSWRNFRKEKN